MNQILKRKQVGLSGKINSLEKQRADIEKQISKTRNYLKSLYEDKVNGVITTEQFKDLIADYNKNEDMYSNQLNEINNEIAYYQMKEESSKNNEKIFSKYQELKKLNRVIVDEFIDKIYIGKLNEEQIVEIFKSNGILNDLYLHNQILNERM